MSVMILLLIPQGICAATETITVPLTLDFPFIRMVLLDQLYTQPGERAVVVDEKTDINCAYIEMQNPEVKSDGSFIVIGSRIKVQGGVPFIGDCKLVNWEGYIETTQRVLLDEKTYQLKLETVDSHVYKTNRQPIVIATKVWDLIKMHVHPYFSKMSINLAFPVDEMRTMLPLFFTDDDRMRAEAWMKTLNLGDVRVEKDAIRLDLAMTVETTPPAAEDPASEMTADEIERISTLWETWDAFLVFQLETLLGETLTDEERRCLFEALIETRYGFVRAMSEKKTGPDLVRQQFVWTWQQLASTLRTHLVKKTGHGDLIKYLAFFTASDVLAALDKLGPSLNLEISRDGLLRLAKLLSTQNVSLAYVPAVDGNLRELLGFGPPLNETGPSYKELEIPFPEEEKGIEEEKSPDITEEVLSRLIDLILISPAYAAESTPTNLEELKEWIVTKENIGPYLDKVRQVLEKTADEALVKSKLDPSYQPLYRLMLMATAWQESCWRQIIKSGGNIQPLFSYTQSSVGLMQINERVWRGIYKTESLRWNIAYNAQAGAEIIGHYLKDYALKKMDPANPLDQDTLGRAVYAIYNGGPAQFQQFLKRSKSNAFYDSDKLFWEKYSMAKAGEFDKVSICLTGK